MFRFNFPILLLSITIASAGCGPTSTPPPGPSQVWINSPENGAVIQLGSQIHWDLQAASFTKVTGFDFTFCDNDNVYALIIPLPLTGEGGAYGSMYYAIQDWTGLTNEPGECTRKVRAKNESGQYSPWVEVTYSVADLYETTSTIQASILSPSQGEVIPLNTDFNVTFKSVSSGEVNLFEFEMCDFPGDLRHLTPDYTEAGGTKSTVTIAEADFPAAEAGPCTLTMRAIAQGSPGQASEWTEVDFLFGESVAEVTPGLPPLLPTPTPTLVIIPFFPNLTDTPGSGSFQAAVVKNANCRAGPGTAYNEWGYALKGEVVEVVGRNEDGTWLNVINPHAAGKCWLSIIALDVPFEVLALPPASYPTPPPSAGGDDSTTGQGCWVRSAAGGDTQCVSPCPPGASPGTACTP